MITYLSGPTIAALTGLHRMSVNDLMRLGRYGETVVVDSIRYAALDRVEEIEEAIKAATA